MFDSIRHWFRNRRRRIYRYSDGQRSRYGDPVVLQLALANHPQYLRRHLTEARGGDPEAIKVLCDVADKVFGIQALDAKGRGLTATEMVRLVIDFEIYCEALKKNTPR